MACRRPWPPDVLGLDRIEWWPLLCYGAPAVTSHIPEQSLVVSANVTILGHHRREQYSCSMIATANVWRQSSSSVLPNTQCYIYPYQSNKFFSLISDIKCQSYRDFDAIWILSLINHFIIESKEFDWTYQWVKLLTAQIPWNWLKNSSVFYWQNILWLQNWNRDENKFCAFWLVAALLKYLSLVGAWQGMVSQKNVEC